MNKRRYVSTPLFFIWIILPLLMLSGCESSKYSAPSAKYTIPFVTVREADFRCGPLDLPLNRESRRRISNFLQRGGNRANHDMLDPEAPVHYAELLDLISNLQFLYSSNFREKDQIDQVSKSLEIWFHNPIIY